MPTNIAPPGGTPNYDRWETDPNVITAYLQANANDPALRAAAGNGRLDDVLWQRGYRVPAGWKAGVGPNGQAIVKEKSWWDKNKEWALPAIGIGAAAAGPAILGGLGGAAPGAAGGVGIGETGAVTGLAGSGFGTGGGLGLTGVGGAAAGAGGVGIGETGAVTGLGGSGFGTGAAGAAGDYVGTGTLFGDNFGAMNAASKGGGILGTLGKIGGIAERAAPILGGAAANQAASRRADAQADYLRDRSALESYATGLRAPGTRLATGMNASRILNHQPVTAAWGGPGSGLKGGTVKFSGGSANPNLVDPRTKTLADDIMAQQLEQQLAGGGINRGGPPQPAPRRDENFAEQILGGAGLGAGILGIFGPRRG